jgi:hypothetical protein
LLLDAVGRVARFDAVAMPDEHLAITDEPLIDKDRAQLTMTDDQFEVQTDLFNL